MKYFVPELGCALELQAAPVKGVDATDSCGQCQLLGPSLAEWSPHRGGSGPSQHTPAQSGKRSNRWRVMLTRFTAPLRSCAYAPTTCSSNQWLPSGHLLSPRPRPRLSPFLAHLKLVGLSIPPNLLRATWKEQA